jgi:hypothetical protein
VYSSDRFANAVVMLEFSDGVGLAVAVLIGSWSSHRPRRAAEAPAMRS